MVGAFVALSSLGSAAPVPTPAELAARMRKAANDLGAFSGTETVSVRRTGIRYTVGRRGEAHRDVSDDPSADPILAETLPEGLYRWYTQGPDWWTVKEIPDATGNGRRCCDSPPSGGRVAGW